ncbi:MAG TPA: hypothetical protein IAA58_06390 [Candidatus Gallacutalibacter stercoravium]|nr:hypothetical protein [Candidatus Gallacutalibacter stercoravium]
MDKKTRLLHAMNRLPVDRPPVGFWFHFPGEEGMGEKCVAAHLAYYNSIGVDFAKVMCDNYFAYPLPKIQKASDWRQVRPLGGEHPFIRQQIERVKAVKEGLKDDMCVFYNILAPFSSIRNGSSDEMVMAHLKEDPAAVMQALEAVAEDNALIAEKAIVEGGCTGAYCNVQGGERDRMSYEQYREQITPSDRLVLDHANRFSANNILHCCGWAGVPNRLEVWQDYPAKAVNWAVFIEGMDLAEGQRFFGGKAVLGGFDNRPGGLLCTGGKEEIQAFARSLAQQVPSGLIIGADCTLPADIDRQRIQWVADAFAAQNA